MPQPSQKTDRKAALDGGGKKNVKDVHHLRPIGTPHCSEVTGGVPAPEAVGTAGSETGATATTTTGDSASAKVTTEEKVEHKRPEPEKGPLPARPYQGATALAYEANRYKEFKVVAPLTEEDAHLFTPVGPESVEYAPAHAVPGDIERIPFDRAAIGAETRRINEEADKAKKAADRKVAVLLADLAELNAENEAKLDALDAKKRRKRDEKQPRRDMGDFLDDEDEWRYGRSKRRGNRL